MKGDGQVDRSRYRILLVSTGGGIGGEESFTANLSESLHQRGWDVRVAAVSDVHIQELVRRGVRTERLQIEGRTPWGLLRGARALARYAAEHDVAIVHAQSAGPAVMGIVAKWFGWFSRPRPQLIWHDHGINHYGLLAKLFNHLDISIANSNFERDKLIAHGLKPAKVVPIHNAIDLKRFTFTAEKRAECRRAVRREFGFDEHAPVVGFIGRLSQEKAPDDFVASFQHAHRMLPDIRYLIVGDGMMRPQLERMIRELHEEDRIVLAGFRRDIPELLCGIDALALVSHMETFGLTTLDAMAMRLPCVVTAVGGNPEQVTDGENGRVVPDRSPEQIAEALVDILSDPTKKEAFGQAGYQRAHAYFDIDRMVNEVEGVYFELLERRSRRQPR